MYIFSCNDILCICYFIYQMICNPFTYHALISTSLCHFGPGTICTSSWRTTRARPPRSTPRPFIRRSSWSCRVVHRTDTADTADTVKSARNGRSGRNWHGGWRQWDPWCPWNQVPKFKNNRMCCVEHVQCYCTWSWCYICMIVDDCFPRRFPIFSDMLQFSSRCSKECPLWKSFPQSIWVAAEYADASKTNIGHLWICFGWWEK